MYLKGLAALGGACALVVGYAAAESEPAAQSRPALMRPVVVEMFLSQSCTQSPPAAALLARLAARPDVVALSWHVDYWDSIPGRGVGPWKDPFAAPEFAARQLAYNQRFTGRAAKLTPQTVIDGVMTLSGSKAAAVETTIMEAQFLEEMARPAPPQITLTHRKNGAVRARIENVGAPYDALVVNFSPSIETAIKGGDNNGVVFREANVVRSVETLARAHSGAGDFAFDMPGDNLDCALLVQERNYGRIVAARYCSDR
ncbi:MAG: DUF1223 domain-containing protein [Parvularculaceae bacterium]